MAFANRWKIFVGIQQRVDGVSRWGSDAYVTLSIQDDGETTRKINLQTSDARDLSKMLKKMADLADPPKPRARKS